MDPLSIASGVVGLVTASAAVIKYLDSAKSNIQDAPRTITWAKAEITDIRSAIVRLNDLFQDPESVPKGARTAVGVQEAVVAVHELVFSFDWLSHMLKPFNVEDPAMLAKWDKVKWLRVQDDVVKYVLRLQTHKGSITLMLNILQCESDRVILESQRALEKKIDTLLDENEMTQKRMARLEMQFYNFILSNPNSLSPGRVSLAPSITRATGSDSMSVRSATDRPQASAGNPALSIECPKAQTDASSSAITTTRITEPSLSDSPKASEPATDASSPPAIRLEFEETLKESNVYRRVHNPSDAFSTLSADGRSVAGSVMTSYSLADDSSILSAFPIMNRSDLQHPEYYEDAAGDNRLSKGLLKAVVSRGVTSSGQKDPAAPFSLRNFRYPPELGLNCIGQWSQSKTRIFRRSELRFEILFDVPYFFVCPPGNTNGPIRNASIYYLDGTPQSLRSTWSDLNSDIAFEMVPKERARMGDGERATWLLLLSSLQRMEFESTQWQRREIEELHLTVAKLSPVEPPSLRDHHTLMAAIQRKRRSWDSLPLTFRRPYATTNFCHLVEIVAMLGIYWKEFNRTYHIYRAEGNGFLVTGYMVAGLGIMFSFQATGRHEFGHNRIIPADEVKELCFGVVPTIYRDLNDAGRLEFLKEDPSNLSVLLLGSRREIAGTLGLIGCNTNASNAFLDEKWNVKHLFPVAFEVLGMLSRTFHIKDTMFTHIPNPTPDRWDKRSVSLIKVMEAYRDLVPEGLLVVHRNMNLIERIGKHTENILELHRDQDLRKKMCLLKALHEAIDDCDRVLTAKETDAMTPPPELQLGKAGHETELQTARREIVQDVLRSHIQEVLRLLNGDDRSDNSSLHADRSPLVRDSRRDGQPRVTPNGFEDMHEASPDERQHIFMEVYFYVIRPSVISRATRSTDHRRASLVAPPAGAPPGFGFRRQGTGQTLASSIRGTERGPSPTRPAPPQTVNEVPSPPTTSIPNGRSSLVERPRSATGESVALAEDPEKQSLLPLSIQEVSHDDVWCTLMFRMICWLMLHDFNKLDVQVSKGELRGNRMPVYIS